MKIVSMGAVLMDQVASVARFPQEDDEVFVPRMRLMPGGSAANFAVFCARLGIETGFVGKVGKDALGDSLVEDLRSEGVDIAEIPRSDLPTGTVFIALDKKGQRMMFAYSGAANDLSGADLDMDHLNGFGHLHLADLENVGVLRKAAEIFEGTVSLNPGALIAEKRDEALELLKESDIITCSEGEAKRLAGGNSIQQNLRALCEMGPGVAVVTRGPGNPLAFDGNEVLSSPTHDIGVADATGAGDSFSAGFVSEYLKTKDVQESLDFAVAVSEIVVQNRGARGGLRNRAQVEKSLGAGIGENPQ